MNIDDFYKTVRKERGCRIKWIFIHMAENELNATALLCYIFSALIIAASTALITVLRNAPSSSAATPSIVVPAGEQTISLRTAG